MCEREREGVGERERVRERDDVCASERESAEGVAIPGGTPHLGFRAQFKNNYYAEM